MNSWNPVLNLILSIKWNVQRIADNDIIWANIDKPRVQYWVELLRASEVDCYMYNDFIDNVMFTDYGDLTLVKYNSLGVDFYAYDGLFRECRSVVIDLYNERLVLAPYRKFFNLNEHPECSIDVIKSMVSAATVVEVADKLDGSMQSYRWYDGKIVGSGSQALDAGNSFRLAGGYKIIDDNPNYTVMMYNNSMFTFVFEYIDPINDPHVVSYDEVALILTGIRDVGTGYQYDNQFVAEIADEYGVPYAPQMNMTFEEALEDINNDTRSADEGEGYVVNINGYRVKMKYEDYVSMHHVLGGYVSHNYVIAAIADGTIDDFYAKVPYIYKERVKNIIDTVNGYVNYMKGSVNEWYNSIPYDLLDSRKDAMIWITENVPREFQNYCRMKYVGKPVDYLKGKKYSDMQIF